MLIIRKMEMDLERRDTILSRMTAVQNDTYTRALELTLYAGGVSWIVPSGTTISVAYRKPDGTSGWYDTLPDGNAAATHSGNTVTVTLAPQMLTAPGAVVAAVIFQDAELNQLATFPIRIQVEPNPAAGQVVSNDYYQLKNLDQINAAYNKLLEQGTVSDEQIANAVRAYLAEHPVQGGVDEEQLTEAVNDALEQAKENGYFDGKNGNNGITPTIGSNGNWYLGDTDTGKPSRGAVGPAGKTPVKGTDYWTEEDKQEILGELEGGISAPAYVRTAAEGVAEKILSVTGEAISEEPGIGYTNQLPISIDTDGSPYNGGTGYKTGFRLNSSGAEKQITESYFDASVGVTGFIPCHAGDTIRVSGMVIDPADVQASSYNITVYNANYTKVILTCWNNIVNHATTTTDSKGYIDSITLVGNFGDSSVAYIRLSAKNITAESIVTVNEEIKEGSAITVDESCVPFTLAFVTDIHWADADASRIRSARQALGIIAETAPIDAVVFGGDYIQNWSEITAAAAKEDMANCRKSFADAVDVPTLWLRGNHDNNPYPDERLTKADIFGRIGRAQHTLPGYVSNWNDPYGGYGYMDFENARIRLVAVNTSDNDQFGEPDMSGGSYSVLLDAYHIGVGQLQWIADYALDLSEKENPGDWGIIFTSHVPIYSTNSWYNSHTYTDGSGKVWTCNVINLAELAKAYRDKTIFTATINGETVTKDFSGVAAPATILGFINGHKHAMITTTYNGFSFISCPNACNNGEKASDDGITYTKGSAGTAEETAFTVLSIDPANKKIYAWVYGAGYDRDIDI